jgi:hypothetical protein
MKLAALPLNEALRLLAGDARGGRRRRHGLLELSWRLLAGRQNTATEPTVRAEPLEDVAGHIRTIASPRENDLGNKLARTGLKPWVCVGLRKNLLAGSLFC